MSTLLIMCHDRNVRVRWDEGKFTKQVARDVVMNLPGIATFDGVDLDGRDCRVQMRLDMTAEGVRPVEVLVSSTDGAPITGTTLRAVRVLDLARTASAMGIRRGYGSRDGSGASFSADVKLTPDMVARIKEQGPVRESLEWAAYVYNVARVLGDPPAKAVELTFEMPRTTASKWVRRARELGLIDEEVFGDDGEHRETP